MSGIFSTVKRLLTYRPLEAPMFEFLEDENEGNEAKRTKQPANRDTSNKNDKSEKKQVKKSSENTSEKISSRLFENLETIKREFHVSKNQDIIIREFKIAKKINAFLFYVDGMVDKVTLNNTILRQLMNPKHFIENEIDNPIDYIMDNVLSVNQLEKAETFDKVNTQVLNGITSLFIDGCSECLLLETRGYEKRNIDKPVTETVIRGSHEGFTENLRTNLTLIRRFIKNKNLVTEILPMGATNKLSCAIVYLEGVANPRIINEVKRRIKSIDVDFIGGDGMLAQLVEDNPFMLLPQTLSTERPDRAASFIMEGQVVFFGEGTPFAEVVPVTFFHMFHTSEDSYLRWQYGTFLRLIRVFGILVGVLLPGLYVALNLYRQELIPTELLSAIAEAREKVPFPLVVEILMMEASFELIREAGVRVPGVIGNTLGIIGALILGQAAVAANLVSPILIIVVAVTGLGNFSIPNYYMALGLRILRFVYLFSGAIAGFYGVSLAIFITGGLACSMKSFGVPFLSPVAPKLRYSADLIIKQPLWRQKKRFDANNVLNEKRLGDKARGWINKGKDKNKGGDKN